ncbi:S-adenosyl-L-methionine-dependent methyltransferases superfamily protein [Arabidopsis thaliana]|uniref:S-adenosyl-L-methionine-dependent methyltransferases superfamily protein n=1 Tax=Arabidopsis thaliana TaxID=3702 RepID=A0A1I9LMQ3_ARATH|nr:S-adenosyl-L-methionine-dependent methyltransferases superfamily protein [Arabidopsis thaliana]ANM63861.1 S-adenosyl-L-methionine-dependent methyltransferases superfamily protein [Arabidopsis thaliana]|eukprot:NP_001325928.1 S-adenosyl-L-methionine-dependent methyltransferases superfamily protein [Arabidopsis thaliana]
MAFGRGRGNKRTSTSSYASTITMVIFVALCVFGVWMLSSNSVIPPQITQGSTRAAVAETERSDVSASSNGNDEPEPTKQESDEQQAFEDNPGKLPDDAVKSEDEQRKSAKEKSETTSSKTQTQETQQNNDDKISEEKEKDNGKENQTVQESEEGQMKKVVKEFEKEQKQQRDEDAGTQPKGTQGQEQGQGKEQPDVEQGNKQGQEQDSNTDVTFTDATKQEQPMETGQGETSETSKNEENGQPEEQNSGNEETGQQNEEKTTASEENGKGEKSMKDENGQQEEHTTAEEESGNKEEESTSKDENMEQQEERKDEKKHEQGSEASGFGSGIPKESAESQKSWKSQATESKDEKQRQTSESNTVERIMDGNAWVLCNATAGTDYIPCLDNEEAIMKLRSRRHFEHRERHCPEDPPTCLVPLPEGYKEAIKWPESRDKIWYHNVPHTKLAEVKGHQNWVKVTGEFLTFPGGGTQFIHGALHYIDFLQQSLKNIAWGKRTRVILDVGCGVASFGGFLFERDVIAMSLAPKDEHEAQVQFALERKIPAISAVMGSKRLPFPSRVFDLIHCARCRVPWHNEGGMLLLELNRMLRPGGYFVWSATPVYQKLEEDVQIWKEMSALTKSLCWELVTINKDKLNGIGAAIYQKPATNECYEKRKHNKPPLCKNNDDANAAWYVPLQACMHKVPTNVVERGSKWPVNWPRRLQTPPYWLNSSQMGIYGKPAPRDFTTDYEHWKHVVSKVYMNEIGISWSNVRNVMDMRAVYGGFAAALKDLQVWVMNVVNINSPDTLPIIYERGLFGIYHDWCESFSTYPRSYDLLHADHLFSKLRTRYKRNS